MDVQEECAKFGVVRGFKYDGDSTVGYKVNWQVVHGSSTLSRDMWSANVSPSFHNMRRLGVLIVPINEMKVQHMLTVTSIWSGFLTITHLYFRVEREIEAVLS